MGMPRKAENRYSGLVRSLYFMSMVVFMVVAIVVAALRAATTLEAFCLVLASLVADARPLVFAVRAVDFAEGLLTSDFFVIAMV